MGETWTNEYLKFFETIRDLLIEDLMEKRCDLKKG